MSPVNAPLYCKFRADESGAVLVEFTLILVPFLVMLLGLVELGRYAWTREALVDIAIETARCMAVGQAPCGGQSFNPALTLEKIQTMAAQRLLNIPVSGIQFDNDANCGGIGAFSKVEITFDYDPNFKIPPVSDVLSKTLSVSACFPNQF